MFTVRCPACHTVFRASSQQLGAHAGRVRCGRCHHAFNAKENLLGDSTCSDTNKVSTDSSADTNPSEPDVRRPDTRSASRAQEPRHSLDDLDFVIPDTIDIRPSDSSLIDIDLPARADEGLMTPSPADLRNPPSRSSVDEAAGEPLDFAEKQKAPAAQAGTAARDQRVEPGLSPINDEEEYSQPLLTDDDNRFDYYNQQPERSGSWLWAILVGLALGCLLMQSAYVFRQDIASRWPESRPWFVLACEHLGCEMSLPGDIAAIRISTSDLESDPERPGYYVLHAQVRNEAQHAQRYPHLELTLTGSRGSPLARRVLTPAEWAAEAENSSSFSAQTNVSLRLPFSAPDLQGAAGYRLYAFYP